MMQLLVSVRDADEANAALAGGADLIDVKEPRRGALGMAAGRQLEQIANTIESQPDPRAIPRHSAESAGDPATVAAAPPLSAALGELADLTADWPAIVPRAYGYVKAGLAGMGGDPTWRRHFETRIVNAPHPAAPVAVIYADWRACNAPPPREVLTAAAQLNCMALLIDTHDKHHGTVFDVASIEELNQWCCDARRLGLLSVLGGSLSLRDIPQIRSIAPDVVAVRTAACDGGRVGSVVADRVAALAEAVHVQIFQRGRGNA